jgi:nucleoside-diphosphate-sugar epimerase
MNYLVTGSAGFIASRVVTQLLEEGHSVVGIDNLNDYYDVSLKEHRLAKLKKLEGDFQFQRLDLEDLSGLGDLFKSHSFDTVLNLAARAGVRYSMENPHVYMSTNAVGNLNLLEQMRQHEVNRYVLASTSSLYAGQEMPFVESLAVNTPISPYAASKKAAEAMSFAYHHLYSIDVSIVRFFTVYGPADRPDMAVHRFIQWVDQGVPIKLFGDGSQSRDFTFVDDIARGTILASKKKMGYEVINLGGGNRPVSINKVIEMIENLLGKKALIEHLAPFKADMKSTWADISKAEKVLDWKPEISIEEGLDRCVQWYQENLPWSSTIKLN